MSDLLEKPTTVVFEVTEYRRGCDVKELIGKAASLSESDEYISGRLDDGFGVVEWGPKPQTEAA